MDSLRIESEEQISPAIPWLARVLMGSHSGATIKLHDGHQSLGRGENCDIVLWDEALPDVLMHLDTSDDAVTLSLAQPASRVTVDGRVRTENVITVTSQSTVVIDDLALGFFREGEEWRPAPPKSLDSTVSQPKRMWVPLVLTVLVAAGLFWAYGPGSKPSHSGSQKTEVQRPKLVLAQILSDLGITTVSASKSGRELSGVVKDAATKAMLVAKLKEHGINKDASQLILLDDQIRLAQATLSNLGISEVTVSASSKAGYVLLSGYVKDTNRWERARFRLFQDVPAPIFWDDTVETLESRVEILRAMIATYGLDKAMAITIGSNLNVEVRGNLGPAEQQIWNQVQAEFSAKFSEPALLAAKPDIKELKIRSITLGAIPYITLASGDILVAGAELENNYTIREILRDRIVLERQGELINYNLDDNFKK